MFLYRLVVWFLTFGLACSAAAQSAPAAEAAPTSQPAGTVVPSPASPPAPATEAPRICGPRIIPCSPLLTEMVFQMGLGDCVVAVSRFWEPPPGVERPVVADRANVQTEAIVTLRPDILLVQQNVRDFDPVKQLLPDVRVEFFRIETLDDYAQAVTRVADIVGDQKWWTAKKFNDALESVQARVAHLPKKRVLLGGYYQLFSANGTGTFHDDMIRFAGGINATDAGGYKGWNIRLNNEGVMALAPDVIVCMIAEGAEETARAFFAEMSTVPAVRDGRVFFITDKRWNVMSMHTTTQVKQLAEMIHGPLPGEEIGAAEKRNVFFPMVVLGVAAATLFVGGVALAVVPRKRGVKR